MKRIKIILSVLLIVTVNLSLFAQDKKVEFGLSGGYSYTMPKLKNSNVNDNLPGFHIGPMLRFNIDERFSIRTSLFYNYFSGINITNNMLKVKKATGTWEQTKTVSSSVDLPIRVAMQAPLAEDLYFFLTAGPNLSYGIDKVSSLERYSDNKLLKPLPEHTGDNIYDSEDYNKMDLQLGVSMGLQWRGILLQGSYDWGILDRNTKKDVTLRNNDLKVTLGYYF